MVQCQECYLPKILTELDKGGKESCWAWYIFPTEKAGFSDFDETRITSENAVDLCCHESTAEDWRRCLEKICDLLEATPGYGYTGYTPSSIQQNPSTPLGSRNEHVHTCAHVYVHPWYLFQAACQASSFTQRLHMFTL